MENIEVDKFVDDTEDSKPTIIKIILIVVLFSPLFSSAIIFLLFAGISNVMYYIFLIAIVVYLSYYSISHYRRTLEQRNSIIM